MPVGPTGALRWMAKFDISLGYAGDNAADIDEPRDAHKAIPAPAPALRSLGTDSIRMRAPKVRANRVQWGMSTPPRLTSMCAMLVGLAGSAAADPSTGTIPDPPPRQHPPVIGPGRLPPSWDLDGMYLWLGPSGAASHIATAWDSTFGGDATVVRVREQRLVSVVGGTFGASRWTERGGGRVWLDAIAGTRIGTSRMIGVSAGPMVELSDLAHPRYGGSVGVWAFAGVTPFARVGTVDKLGTFAEIGLHITLPVLRW
jgi:hypothetical protein